MPQGGMRVRLAAFEVYGGLLQVREEFLLGHLQGRSRVPKSRCLSGVCVQLILMASFHTSRGVAFRSATKILMLLVKSIATHDMSRVGGILGPANFQKIISGSLILMAARKKFSAKFLVININEGPRPHAEPNSTGRDLSVPDPHLIGLVSVWQSQMELWIRSIWQWRMLLAC